MGGKQACFSFVHWCGCVARRMYLGVNVILVLYWCVPAVDSNSMNESPGWWSMGNRRVSIHCGAHINMDINLTNRQYTQHSRFRATSRNIKIICKSWLNLSRCCFVAIDETVKSIAQCTRIVIITIHRTQMSVMVVMWNAYIRNEKFCVENQINRDNQQWNSLNSANEI